MKSIVIYEVLSADEMAKNMSPDFLKPGRHNKHDHIRGLAGMIFISETVLKGIWDLPPRPS